MNQKLWGATREMIGARGRNDYCKKESSSKNWVLGCQIWDVSLLPSCSLKNSGCVAGSQPSLPQTSFSRQLPSTLSYLLVSLQPCCLLVSSHRDTANLQVEAHLMFPSKNLPTFILQSLPHKLLQPGVLLSAGAGSFHPYSLALTCPLYSRSCRPGMDFPTVWVHFPGCSLPSYVISISFSHRKLNSTLNASPLLGLLNSKSILHSLGSPNQNSSWIWISFSHDVQHWPKQFCQLCVQMEPQPPSSVLLHCLL